MSFFVKTVFVARAVSSFSTVPVAGSRTSRSFTGTAERFTASNCSERFSPGRTVVRSVTASKCRPRQAAMILSTAASFSVRQKLSPSPLNAFRSVSSAGTLAAGSAGAKAACSARIFSAMPSAPGTRAQVVSMPSKSRSPGPVDAASGSPATV